MEHAFSIQESFAFGWRRFKERPWLFVKAALLIGAVTIAFNIAGSVLGVLLKAFSGPAVIFIALLSLALNVFSIYVTVVLNQMGLLTLYLKAHDGVEGLSLKELWRPHPFWRYFLTNFLVGICAALGLVLLIVPGVILLLVFSMTAYLILSRDIRGIDAMKESARLTKGSRWRLFLLVLAILLANIAGALCLLVGLFVTAPVSALAFVHAFRALEAKQEGLSAPVAVP